MPTDEGMFFPPRDCRPEQEMVKGSELRVIEDTLGHLALFGVAPTYLPPIDEHLGELLSREV
jgi:homoserine O-acetyltransferase